jgi:hypothetical protein
MDPITGPPRADGVLLLPVVERSADRSRPVGAFVAGDRGRVRFVPVVDVQRLALYTLAGVTGALAAGTVATALRRDRGPSIGTVHMGPGGWVSLKRTASPMLRTERRSRPWWARLLRARRLVVE